MKTLLFVLAAALVACSAEEPEPTQATGLTMDEFATTTDIVAWAQEFGASADDLEVLEPGVAVSARNRTVYAFDCARGETYVVEGAEFGPVPRAE
ncbi:MAG: hypothetical protein ABR616_18075, partial [Dermatophilaceae bacterium]